MPLTRFIVRIGATNPADHAKTSAEIVVEPSDSLAVPLASKSRPTMTPAGSPNKLLMKLKY